MRYSFLLAICLVGPACADDAAPLPAEEKRLLQERAKALRDSASAMRKEAEATLAVDTKACWDKFLVSQCMEEAKQAKIGKLSAVRGIEQEAREIERNLKRRAFADHEAKAAAEAPLREAEAAEQAERNRKAQQEAMERVERKRQEAERREKR